MKTINYHKSNRITLERKYDYTVSLIRTYTFNQVYFKTALFRTIILLSFNYSLLPKVYVILST